MRRKKVLSEDRNLPTKMYFRVMHHLLDYVLERYVLTPVVSQLPC
jgi:hypothetical protein